MQPDDDVLGRRPSGTGSRPRLEIDPAPDAGLRGRGRSSLPSTLDDLVDRASTAREVASLLVEQAVRAQQRSSAVGLLFRGTS